MNFFLQFILRVADDNGNIPVTPRVIVRKNGHTAHQDGCFILREAV